MHIDQWIRLKNPEIDSQRYSQLVFNKGTKIIQWREGSPFQPKWGDLNTNLMTVIKIK